MKSLLKSLFLAFAGTGIFFCFLMMLTVPIQAMVTRLGTNVQKTSVVVNPDTFLRTYGLPSAAILFVVLFAIAFHRFRREEQRQLQAVRH